MVVRFHRTHIFSGVLYDSTVCRLNGWQNPIGFHGVYMVGLFGGLYMRKLGFILIVNFRAFPVPYNGNKKRCKGGQPLQAVLPVFPLSLCLGNN